MDIRTYDADSDVDGEQMTHFDAHAELAAYAAENARLTHELDAHRRELSALRDERPRLLAANARLADERDARRAELDAMRQAHSVIAARMAAMGC